MAGIVGSDTQADPLSSDSPVETAQTEHKLTLPDRMPDIKPLNGKVVVRRFEADSVTKGGLILPEKGRKKPSEGIVIAVGEGRILDSGEVIAPRISFRDHVLFPQVCGTDVKIDDLDYTIIDETEVLAIINTGEDREWDERLKQLKAETADDVD